jgi:hypothetical protein
MAVWQTHPRYAVLTPSGWLGVNRFKYGKGRTANEGAQARYAKLFTRRGDAEQAAKGIGEVVEIFCGTGGHAVQPAATV